MRALVIGGTGPTGPHIAGGLLDRGYQVTVFHRGTHEVPELAGLEHIHGDPHFYATTVDALGTRIFDLVIATYGRTRLLADALAGRCARFVAASGVAVYRGYLQTVDAPTGCLPIRAGEDSPQADPGEAAADPNDLFVRRMIRTERSILAHHEARSFAATLLRYPIVYGPRQPFPREWSVIKRALDGRLRMILPDGGLPIVSRGAARNVAHAVLCAVDRPQTAAGNVYNIADQAQFSLRQWAEQIIDILGCQLAIAGLPDALAWPARPLLPMHRGSDHSFVSTQRIESELGYRDVVEPTVALRDCVAHYLDEPPDKLALNNLGDAFDYAAEDAQLAFYDEMIRRAPAISGDAERSVVHPYPHPRSHDLRQDHRGR